MLSLQTELLRIANFWGGGGDCALGRGLMLIFDVHIGCSSCTCRWWFRDIKISLGKRQEMVWACSWQTLPHVPSIAPANSQYTNTDTSVKHSKTDRKASESTVLHSSQESNSNSFKLRWAMRNAGCHTGNNTETLPHATEKAAMWTTATRTGKATRQKAELNCSGFQR